MIKIENAKHKAEYKTIADLAAVIWTEHYTPIIGVDQVNYMLEKFQSEKAIANQIGNDVKYYIIYDDERPAGYISYKLEAEHLFLSKLYVKSNSRGKGLGRHAIEFIVNQAHKSKCKAIRLTVNKYNSNSIKAYQKLGFIKTETVVMDIGNGFVMDDFVMIKNLNN